MNFCSECGYELREQDVYCAECGTKVEQHAQTDVQQAQTNVKPDVEQQLSEELSDPPSATNPQVPKPRKKMSATVKLIIAFAVIIVVALGGGYVTGSWMFSPERTIAAFEQAVETADHETLRELLQPSTSRMGMDDQDVERLAAYLQKHESDLDDLIETLRSQVQTGDADTDAMFKLITSGKRWLLFDDYQIEVAPYHLTIHTNMADTDLYINGDQVGTARSADYSRKFGPLWPGEHEVKAIYHGEYTLAVEQSQLVTLYDDSEDVVTLEIAASYAWIESSVEDAVIYVNGESTSRTVADFGGEIGPLLFDGKTTLAAEAVFPWGTYRSDEVVLTEDLADEPIAFTFEEAYEAAQTQVMEAVNQFLASWVPAYMNRDISLFTNITEERRSLFASDFQWMLETGQRFTAEIVGSEFDLNSFILYGGYDEYPYAANVDVAYVLKDAAWYYEGEEPLVDDMISFIQYELVYDEDAGQWVISYFTAIEEIDFSHTQAFTYE